MRLNTKTILLIIIVFLLGTNIAVIVTYQSHLQGEKLKIENKIEIPDRQFGRFFNEELNLSNEQQNSFREFRRNYNRAANRILFEMDEIRIEMANTLKSAHPDRKVLDKLAEKLGNKHEALKGLTFDYYFNMQRVLDKVQQEKMVGIFQAMLTETGDAKTPIPNGSGHQGQGRGQGQGWRSMQDSIQTNK